MTEYNLLERGTLFPLHGTWYHGLTMAYLTMHFLENPQIQACNLHTMAGDFIFSDYFGVAPQSNGIYYGFHPTSGFTISQAVVSNYHTKNYTKTAIGLMMNEIAIALKGENKVTPLVFNLASNNDYLPDSKPVAYGWEVVNTKSLDRTLIILNVSDHDISNIDINSTLGFNDPDDAIQITTSTPENYVAEQNPHTNSYDIIDAVSGNIASTFNVALQNVLSLGGASHITLNPFSLIRIRQKGVPRIPLFTITCFADTIDAGTEAMLFSDYDSTVTYQWSTGDTTTNILVTQNETTTYSLNVISKITNAVIFTSQFTLFSRPGIGLTLHNTTISSCAGAIIKLNATATPPAIGPANPYKFVWITSPNNDELSSNNIGLANHLVTYNSGLNIDDYLTVSPTQTTTYTVYVTNGISVSHKSITVIVPSVKLEKEYRFCTTQNTIDLDPVSVNNTGSNYNYEWHFNGITSNTTNEPSLTGIPVNSTSANASLDLTLTVDGCVSNYSTNIIIAECCMSSIPIPATRRVVTNAKSIVDIVTSIDPSAIQNGAIITIDCGQPLNPISEIVFNGKSYIHSDDYSTINSTNDFFNELDFVGCNIYFSEAAALEADPGYIVSFKDCNLMNGCTDMTWQGLVCDNADINFTTIQTGNSLPNKITFAEYAVDVKRGGSLTAKRTEFLDNLISIRATDNNEFGFNNASLRLAANKIWGSGNAQIPLPYVGQARDFQVRPLFGIQLNGITASMDQFAGTFNEFENLNAGIYARNSVLSFRKSKFINMVPTQGYFTHWQVLAFPDEPKATGIYSVADDGKYSFLSFIGDMNNPIIVKNSFDFCNVGIAAKNSSLNIVSAKMQNVEKGITSANAIFKTVNIYENDISASTVGIGSYFADQASITNIKSNIITIDNPISTSIGSTIGIDLADFGNGGFGRVYSVSCNNIIMQRAGRGISLLNINYGVVAGNTISQNQPLIAQDGIMVEGSHFSSIKDNSIGGPASLPLNNMNNGITVSNSSNTSLFNNNINYSRNGISFIGDCRSPNLFKRNSMNNYDIGLYLNSNAKVGTQIDMQNYWGTSYSNNFDADYNIINPTPTDLLNSEFRTNPAVTPLHIFPLQNWFVSSSTPLSTIYYINDCVIAQRVASGNSTNDDSLTVIGQNFINDFKSETKYFAKRDLYKKIKYDALNLISDLEYSSFYNLMKESSAGRIDSIQSQLNKIISEINLQESIKTDSLIKLTFESLNDNSLSDEQTNEILKKLRDLKALQDELSKKNLENWAIVQSDLKTQNNSITDSLDLVGYEKECFKLLLDNFTINEGNFTTNQISYLVQIANLCPLVGGQAVYRARAIVKLFNPNLTYDDETTCNQIVMLRRGRTNVSETGQTAILIGNPLTKESSFKFNKETIEENKLNIYNELTQLISEYVIPIKTKDFIVPSFTTQPGIYFYEIRNSNNTIAKGKMIYIK